jgi:outer membrane protein
MIRRLATSFVVATLGMAAPLTAQSPLTLPEAIARARAKNPDVEVAAAAEREAVQRVTQARASYLPKVDVTESWQRGDQPVFVFSSLLAQRRFTAADFALESLNHPDAVDNFRTAFMVEQSLFDRAAGANVRAAGIGRDMATTGRLLVDHDLLFGVTEAYGRVLVAAAANQSADAAVEAARADRERASNRRDAGLVTDADVLQLDVHLARTREQQIRAASEERIARARLNQVMGEPLDAVFSLDPTPAAAAIAMMDVATLEAEALRNRPDVKLAALQEQLAVAATEAARTTFLPQVAAQGGWEVNGGTWNSRTPSWVVGAVARINLFHGLADQARLTEAREQTRRRTSEREKRETAARFDVRIAIERLNTARASEAVGRAAADQARESQRIVRDRYQGGMTDVASLLRAAEAVLQSETQQVSAQAEVLVAAAGLERALGRR